MVTFAPKMTLSQPYHRHYWKLYITNLSLPETADEVPEIVARCECGAEMDEGDIERVLNNERLLTDD